MPGRHFLLGVVVGIILSLVLAGALVLYLQTRPVIAPRLPAHSGRTQLSITADEALLSELVTEAARDQDQTMDSVVVDLRPGGWLDILIGAKVTVAGETAAVRLGLSTVLSVRDGGLELVVSQVELAEVPISVDLLPAAIRERIDSLVGNANQLFAETLVRSGLEVVAARTDDTTLTLSMALAHQ